MRQRHFAIKSLAKVKCSRAYFATIKKLFTANSAPRDHLAISPSRNSQQISGLYPWARLVLDHTDTDALGIYLSVCWHL